MSEQHLVGLILVRHTRTRDHEQHRYTGQADSPLTRDGVRQIEDIVQRLPQHYERIRAVYTSDLARARCLGEQLANTLNIELITSPLLREVHVGELTGLTKEEMNTRFPAPTLRASHPQFDFSSVGGETAQHVLDRHHRILHEILERFGSPLYKGLVQNNVILVGHGSSFKLVFEKTHRIIPHLHDVGSFQQCVWPPRGITKKSWLVY